MSIPSMFAAAAPIAFLALAACAGDAPPRASAPPPRASSAQTGLDRVIGHDLRSLVALFGQPDLDVREGPARKAQFVNGVCVLDAYLYPPSTGREPVVRYIDARNLRGDDYDRVACITSLSRNDNIPQ